MEPVVELEKPIRRQLTLEGEPYTIVVSREGVRITPKGRRKGREMSWQTLLSGDADLTPQLRISLDATEGMRGEDA